MVSSGLKKTSKYQSYTMLQLKKKDKVLLNVCNCSSVFLQNDCFFETTIKIKITKVRRSFSNLILVKYLKIGYLESKSCAR